MSEVISGDARAVGAGPVRAPQSLIGGLLLIALAALALYLTRDLDQGTLNAMGPAMLPRWLAIGVGLSGLALVVFGFLKEGDALERWSLRGPVFVIGAILAFAVTIRPFSFGGVATPGLGLLVSGALAIILGGCGPPPARPRLQRRPGPDQSRAGLPGLPRRPPGGRSAGGGRHRRHRDAPAHHLRPGRH